MSTRSGVRMRVELTKIPNVQDEDGVCAMCMMPGTQRNVLCITFSRASVTQCGEPFCLMCVPSANQSTCFPYFLLR